MRRVALAFLALLGAAAVLGADAFADCHVPRGAHVTLFGGVDDPDVLVWDSRARLVTYAGGSSDTRSFLMPHALLTRPGTKALVQYCVSRIVQSKFRSLPEDAIGILIQSGPYRGRYGWVTSTDLRGKGIPELADPWQ